MQKRTLGRTGLSVSPVCVGTSALGSHPTQYGYEVSHETAVQTIRRVLDGPFNFIDTSNEYGHGGDSERRIGEALKEAGGLPAGVVVATKVDPLVGTTDFSGDRVRKSVEESLERLGLDKLQLVYFHDPEKITFEEGTAPGGPLEALIDLKNQGVIEHLGVAGGPIDLELKYLATDAFDVVISHNRYTLVDQTAEPLIQDAASRSVAFVNAAPFGGGMLVKGPDAVPELLLQPRKPGDHGTGPKDGTAVQGARCAPGRRGAAVLHPGPTHRVHDCGHVRTPPRRPDSRTRRVGHSRRVVGRTDSAGPRRFRRIGITAGPSQAP